MSSGERTSNLAATSSSLLEYVRASVMTAPEELELHALLPWVRGEEPFPLSCAPAFDALALEWWNAQVDARELLKALQAVDVRLTVQAACVCARWALDRYWKARDERPRELLRLVEDWCRGAVTQEQLLRAKGRAEQARRPFRASTPEYNAITSVIDAALCIERATEAEYAAVDAAYTVGYATLSVEKKERVYEELSKLLRAEIACPPAEVWLRTAAE